MKKVNEGYTFEMRSAAQKKRWQHTSKSVKKKQVKKLQKGLKKYYKNVSTEAKAAHFEKIHKKSRAYHANMSKEQKKAISDERKKFMAGYYDSYEGYLARLYHSYRVKFANDHRSPEDRKALHIKMGNNFGDKRHVFKIPKRKKKRSRNIQEDVPRVKDFCGVVTEKEFAETNGY